MIMLSFSGIGFETALGLAGQNARVILACRNEKKAVASCKKITDETGNKNVIYKNLDLCSFKSIHKFASEIKAEESNVDVLINNAGVLGKCELVEGSSFGRTDSVMDLYTPGPAFKTRCVWYDFY